jgi:hypothetical protein
MLTDPPVLRKCPACEHLIRNYEIVSGNTFGAICWSDGCTDAPMLPDQLELVKCPQCRHLLWIEEEAQALKELWGSPEFQRKWPESADPEVPNENEYVKFANSNELPRDKEIYVRTRAWWSANDRKRDRDPNDSSEEEFSTEQKTNLLRLRDLLDDVNASDRLMKAEIARELGQFDEALALLDFSFSKGMSVYVTTIKKLAEDKIKQVRAIRFDMLE